MSPFLSSLRRRAHSAHRVSCEAAWAGWSLLPLHQSKTRCKFSSSLALFLCSCGSGAGGACWRGIWAEASQKLLMPGPSAGSGIWTMGGPFDEIWPSRREGSGSLEACFCYLLTSNSQFWPGPRKNGRESEYPRPYSTVSDPAAEILIAAPGCAAALKSPSQNSPSPRAHEAGMSFAVNYADYPPRWVHTSTYL